MYIESVPNRNSPPAILLRESFRDGAKIKKRTIANLSDWPAELVEGLRTLLKGGTATPADRESIIVRQPCRTVMSPPCSARCAPSGLIAFSVRPATGRAISSLQ
jgi:hypothetical protein